MSFYDGPFYPRSKPRKVDGGIKARSTRGSIGSSWWSRRFVDVLESFALGSRMTRGRAYARAGQVVALRVAPGAVTAQVQGSMARPYRVTIGLARFPEPVWARVEAALAEQAIYSARLLAGEVPPDLEEVFAAAGAPLFPARVRELEMRCSCPDSAVPCKHLAATCYLLAEAFDADPFEILHWRGRPRATLLDRLRALRGAEPADPHGAEPADPGGAEPADPHGAEPVDRGVPAGPGGGRPAGAPATGTPVAGARDADAPASGAAAVLAEVTGPPLPDTLDRYWLPPQPLPPRPPTLETEPGLLLRQLPAPGPRLGGAALAERLATAYRSFGARDDGRDDGRAARRSS